MKYYRISVKVWAIRDSEKICTVPPLYVPSPSYIMFNSVYTPWRYRTVINNM